MGRVSGRDPIAVVEAAYRLGSDDDWLRGVCTAAAPSLDGGFGVMGVIFRVAPGEWDTVAAQSEGCDPRFVEAYRVMLGDDSWGPHATAAALSRSSFCTTITEQFGDALSVTASYREHMAPAGIHDVLSILAQDPGGQGCALNAALPRATRLRAHVIRRWGRVAAHLAAGMRVRRAVEKDDVFDGADAILDARGRCAHAEAPAASRTARDTLAASARAVDRARGPLRRADPDEALAVWRGLVAGRWSLLDHVDRDGKRFFVARNNAPAVDPIAALTVAERQVAACAALGHGNKLIAYELGIGESAVAMRLARAARKLGVRSRVGLVRLVRERLFGRGGEP